MSAPIVEPAVAAPVVTPEGVVTPVTPPVVEPTEAGKTPAEEPKESEKSEEPKEPTYEELLAKASLSEKQAGQIKRLTGVIAQTKKQNQEFRQQQQSKTTPPADAPPKPSSLKTNEEGLVEFEGKQWDPETLRMRLELDELKQKNSSLTDRAELQDENAKAAELSKNVTELQGALHQGARDLRTQIFPQYEGEQGESMDAHVVDALEGILRRANEVDEGMDFQSLTPDQAQKYMLEAVRSVAQLMSIPATAQELSNQQHDEEFDVKTKGAPALPAGVKNYFDVAKLPLHEQQKIRRDAERTAEHASKVAQER